jgi:putative SOS response-associated peptidase YedK
VLADGFYEWKATGGKKKQPYHTWRRDDQPIESCTILTTEPNEMTQEIHDRMPVIVGRDYYADWLDAARSGTLADCSYLGPYPAGEMTAVPVSTHVNSAKNNDPACLTPVALGMAK